MYQYKIPILYNILYNNDDSNIDINKKNNVDIIQQLNPEYIKVNKKGFADLLSCCIKTTYQIQLAKNKIENIKENLWEEIKQATNPYELIYATPCVSVAKIKPMSRSFFKMIEMIYEFANGDGNMNGLMDIDVLISLHIAEGPGGFIEATRYIRQLKGFSNDTAFGITLTNKSDNGKNIKNIPAWKQSDNFLKNHPEVILSYGADGTGNIYKSININHLYNEIHTYCSNKYTNLSNTCTANISSSYTDFYNDKNIYTKLELDFTNDIYSFVNKNNIYSDMKSDSECSSDKINNEIINKGYALFITADGGFDYGIDYNYQEQASSKLIFSQIITALKCQAINGIFICKIFDINLFITIEMIYILHLFYKKVIIYKPFTSRIANSEKYLICISFKGIDTQLIKKMELILEEWNKANLEEKTFNRLGLEIADSFIDNIKSINQTIISNQINVINNIMNLYYNKLIFNSEWKKENTKKQYTNAIEWCRKYKIPYNNLNLLNYTIRQEK